MCFDFLYNFSEKFLILRRNERDIIKKVYQSLCKVPVILVRVLMKLEFSQQIWEKYSDVKFHENPSNWSGGVPCGRTDRRTKLIVASRNFIKAPKKKSDPPVPVCVFETDCEVVSIKLQAFCAVIVPITLRLNTLAVLFNVHLFRLM